MFSIEVLKEIEWKRGGPCDEKKGVKNFPLYLNPAGSDHH